jgi:hypothetical protein
MALFRRTSSDAHWSKDYIEHLRSVHFVLIAVAVTCLVVSTGPNMTRIKDAQRQLQQILNVRDKRNAESPTTNVHSELRVTFKEINYVSMFENPVDVMRVCASQVYADPLAETYQSVSDWQDLLAHADDIGSFSSLWDRASCIPSIQKLTLLSVADTSIPLSTPRSNVTLSVVSQQPTSKGFKYQSFELVGLKVTDTDKYWHLSAPFSELRLQYQLTEYSKQNHLSGTGDGGAKFGLLVPANHYVRALNTLVETTPQFGVLVYYNISTISRNYGDLSSYREFYPQLNYMNPVDDSWQCFGPFVSCFPDLAEFAKTSNSYPLKDLASLLATELSGQAKDFELAGIKFETEQFTRWGTTVLIVVLLYFYLHLRELSPKVGSNDEGLDVAWLGLYSSLFPRCLFWISVVIVPCAAVLSLGLYAMPNFKDKARLVLYFDVACPTIICAVLGILSCLSAIKLAKLADTARTSPPSASATDLSSMD